MALSPLFSNRGPALLLLLAVGAGCSLLASPLAAVPAEAADDGDFVTIWRATASDRTITMPVSAAAGTYTISWGDNHTDAYDGPGHRSHTYESAGEYTVRISGNITEIRLGGDFANARQLLSIEQWGDARWSSMVSAFEDAYHMEHNAADSPDLSGVSNMSSMFSGAGALDSDLSSWNTSSVTDMSSMFYSADSFNGDISGWDTSSVTDMSSMFYGASAFNGDLSPWDTSSVTDMSRMFNNAFVFNGDVSTWDTSSVTDMSRMFEGAFRFNGDVSTWDTSSVTSMHGMFTAAFAFNADLSSWNTSSVTDTSNMFYSATVFNGDVSTWDTSSVTDTSYMFYSARAFNADLSPWDVSSVTDTSGMFKNARAFNADLSTWDTSSVTDTRNMFEGATAFNGDVSGWDVSSVRSMGGMFSGASSFSQNLGPWYVTLNDTLVRDGSYSAGIAAQNSFLDGHAPSYSLADSDAYPDNANFAISDGNVITMNPGTPAKAAYTINIGAASGGLFGTDNARQVTLNWEPSLPSTAGPGDFATVWQATAGDPAITIPVSAAAAGTYTIDWGDGNTTTYSGPGDRSHTYASAGLYDVLISGDITGIRLGGDPANAGRLLSITQWGDARWTSMESAFAGAGSMAHHAVDSPDLSGVSNMSGMFRGAGAFNADLSDWDVSGVTDMSNAFNGAAAFAGAGLSSWDVSSVTDMDGMFHGAAAFDADLSGWDVSNVTDTGFMFSRAAAFAGNGLSSWDVSSVTGTNHMFFHATAFDADLSGWDVSGVTDMSYMFSDAPAFDADLSGWDVSGVAHMGNMFARAAAFDADLSGWDVSSVTEMNHMFAGASSFDADLSGWDVSGVTTMADMFSSAAAFTGAGLSSWNVSSVTDMDYMFAGSRDFNGDISGWDVSNVGSMDSMFLGASSFGQNLGPWYIALNDTVIHNASFAAKAGAQNPVLRGHGPTYSLADGDGCADNGKFSMSGGGILTINSAPTQDTYRICIAASGGSLFGTGNVQQVTLHWEPSLPQTADPGDFVTVWQATAGDRTITMPVIGAAGTYTINWGDGSTDTYDGPGDRSHTYESAGRYVVLASSNITGIRLGGDPANAKQLLSIEQWGDARWSSMKSAFAHTGDVAHNAADSPDLSGVTDMSSMFLHAGISGANLSSWDTSSATDMTDMFQSATSFSGDISGWDTSSVTDMKGMFADTRSFSGDISGWDTSSVADMSYMFYGATSFDGDISGWDVSSVTNMLNMFQGATSFDGDISGWDVSSVTNMEGALAAATSFNANLSPWNVSSVTDMSRMFSGAYAFNGDLSGWDTSSVTNMGRMFHNAFAFNGDVSGWDTSSVTNMGRMFAVATSFDGDVSGWNTSSVTAMSSMFDNAYAFNGDLSSWDVSGVADMSRMFFAATSFNANLSSWDVSGVTNMERMFQGATSFDGDLSGWDVSNVRNMKAMFNEADSFNQDLSDWDTSGVTVMTSMFYGNNAFNGDISGWDASSVTNMENMFQGATSFDGDVSGWDVSGVTAMARMFSGAAAFSQNLGPWYVTLNDTSVRDGSYSAGIKAQNSFLDGHAPSYSLADSDAYPDNANFAISDGNVITMNPGTPAKAAYVINIGAASGGLFGTGNARQVTLNWESSLPQAGGPGDFATVWQATAGDPAITMPVISAAGPYSIDWGDGNTTTYSGPGDRSHTYESAGEYTVLVSGNVTGVRLGDDRANAKQLLSIEQWGDARWTSMESAFAGASSMAYRAVDSPDLSGVSSMSGMFRGAGAFNADLSGWDVSSVTDMSNAFNGAAAFTGAGLSSWDTSSVTDMDGMFHGAAAFDADLSGWDVSNVTDMGFMFSRAAAFTGAGLSSWDVSSVTGTNHMFFHASAFDADLSGWNVSSVTDMSYMFSDAHDFDADLSGWDVSSVVSMGNMFARTAAFDADLSGWDVSSVTEMNHMFTGASSFDANLSSWDVSGVTTMADMFSSAAAFNGDISSWDVSSVTDMGYMFAGSRDFNGDISGWDVSNVRSMDSMFLGASSFGQNLGPWYIALNDTVIYNASFAAKAGAQNPVLRGHGPTYSLADGDGCADNGKFDISSGGVLTIKSAPAEQDAYRICIAASGGSLFGTGNVQQVTLHWGPSLPQTYDPGDFVTKWRATAGDPTITIPVSAAAGTYTISWGDSNTDAYDGPGHRSHTYESAGEYTVRISGNITEIRLGGDRANAKQMLSIEQWGDARWTSMVSAFEHAGNVAHNAADSPDLSGVSDMSRMFNSADITGANLSSWDTSGVTDMSYMFEDADSFNGDISGWDTSSVTDMSRMFYDAAAFNGDISSWDTSSVTDMSRMFNNAAAFNGDVSTWDTSSVTDMSRMFEGAFVFGGDVSGWDTSSVTSMKGMFAAAFPFNSDLSSWDVSGVTDMSNMFYGASAFDADLSSWNVSSVTDMSGMFFGARAFNGDISGWNVSGATSMRSMFTGASSFSQNLGPWYVTLNDTSVRGASYSASIAAQNSFLDGHAPSYSLAGGDGCADNDRFSISGSGVLTIKSAPAQDTYHICIGASGNGLFGTDNARQLTLSAAALGENRPPVAAAGPDQSVPEGSVVSLNASASSDPDGDIISYNWTISPDAALQNAGTAAPSFTAPEVSSDTDYTLTLTVSDGDASGTDTVVVTVRNVNQQPTADAGSDQTVSEGAAVTLDGSSSSDPDGTPLSYIWTAPAGITLQGADTAAPSFTAPDVSSDTDYVITLNVSDGSLSHTDTVTITVREVNRAPVADAGADRAASERDLVTLDGSGSADPDSDTLTYSWSSVPSLAFSDAATASPTFTAPDVSSDTDYVITLTVSDGSLSHTDTVTITVREVNRAPVADAGADQSVDERATVTLDGSGSSDPDDDALTYYWTAPAGITLSDATVQSPTFTAPDVSSDADYTITLNVSDGSLSHTDTVTITVREVNRAPVADAGADRAASERDLVTLDGSGSADPDSDTLTYSWSSVPSLAFSDAATASPTFTAPDVSSDTDYVITLTVSDGSLSHTDTVTITVREANRAPVADAGADRAASERDLVTLDGSDSSDPDDDALTYSWTSVPSLAFSDAATASPTFTAPDVSSDTDYVITLTVSDGSLSHTDTVTITVREANRAPTADAGSDQSVDERATVTLDGSGSSDPDDDTLTYSWTISPDAALQNAGTAAPSFTAPEVSSDTDYTLTLTVSDGSASGTDTVVITVRNVTPLPTPPPAVPANLTAAAVTTDSVTLTWDDPGDDAITGYKILSRILSPETTLGVLVADTGSAENTHTVSGLEPNTAYAFRIIALSDRGESDTSYFVNARTERVPPPAAPTNLTATAVTADSVTLAWDDPGDDAITGYKILSRIPSPETDLSVLVADTGSAKNTYTVSGLEPNTKYAFRIIALSDHGESKISYFASIRTERVPPPAVPTNLTAAAVTADSVTLTWDDPGDDAITGYKILSRIPSPETDLSVLVADTGSAKNTYTVSGLEPNTKYAFRIIALSDHGESKISYFASIRTERVPPPAVPTNLTAAAVTADSVTLTWDDPGDDAITGYKILSRMTSSETTLSVQVADTGSPDSSYIVTGLEPGTNYAFRVIALNDHGESKPSYFVNITTPSDSR